MKKILFMVIIILSQSVFPQQLKKQISWDAIVSVGYGNVVSGNVIDYYDTKVDVFRYNGIPIETQTKFGGTAIINAGILCNVITNIGAGFLLGYSYSPAYSNYKDIHGMLKINGSVNTFDFAMMVRYIPYKIDRFSIIIKSQIGACHTSFQVSEEIKFNDYPQNNFYAKLSKDGWGPSFQALIGTEIDISPFTLALEGGYKYSSVKVVEHRLEASPDQIELAKRIMELSPIDFGSNGFVFLLSFGFDL